MAPLVTIAIPTYNRSATVGRAIDSALAQTHERLEVLVGDDASTDETGELLGELAERDARVRIVRRVDRLGMVANMDATLRGAAGDYVMLLADDDWLGPRCVERTLAAVQSDGDRGAALGRVAYMRDGEEVAAGQPVALSAAEPAARVRAYFDAVNEDHGNTWLYALAPRAAIERLSPLRNVLGFDWLHVAERAFSGPIALVEETLIFRELGGVSESTARNVRSSGLPSLHAKVPHLVIAREVLADICWRSPVYEPLGPRGRAALAAACASAVPRRNARHVLYALLPEAAQERWRARA